MKKLSVILQLNDENEKEISHIIENLSFADEIIILSKYPKNIQGIEVNLYVIQENNNQKRAEKNAVKFAKNDWIVFVGSNQFISEELKKEIIEKSNSSNLHSSFYVKESLFFFGKTIRFGEFFNKKKIFLFDKTRHAFDDKKTFLYFLFNPTAILKNEIKLLSYLSFDDYNGKLNEIRKEEALLLYKQNVKPNFYHFFVKPLLNFVNQYFLRFGLIDGREGFILAYINSFSILKRYLVLWLLHRNME